MGTVVQFPKRKKAVPASPPTTHHEAPPIGGLWGWIKRLFHFHEWVIIQEGPVRNSQGGLSGHYYEKRCRVCFQHKLDQL